MSAQAYFISTDLDPSSTVTLLQTRDYSPAGKKVWLENGSVKKSFSGAYQFHATRIPLNDSNAITMLESLRSTIAPMVAPYCLMASYAHNMPDYYRIDSQKALVNAKENTIARLKENFTPSRVLLLDFDAAPPAYENASIYQKLDALAIVIPEIKEAAKLIIPSSSSRIALDGKPVGNTKGYHVYIVLNTSITSEQLDALRGDIERRLFASELFYQTETKDGKLLKRSIIDTAVFSNSRLIFDGAPEVIAPLELLPFTSEIIDGGYATFDFATLKPATKKITITSGTKPLKTVGETSFEREINTKDKTLNSLTIIEPLNGKSFSVQDFIENPENYYNDHDSVGNKVRCQSPFRVSESFAAFLRITNTGCALHDAGSGITYLYNKRNTATLAERLVELKQCSNSAQVQALATDIAHTMQWKVPHFLSIATVANLLHTANNAVNRDAIKRQLEQSFNKRVARIKQSRVILNSALVNVKHYSDIKDIYSSIASGAFDGIHLIAAAHGTGKTQAVLAPLSDCFSNVIGVAPRRTLVDGLQKTLKTRHYRKLKKGEAPNKLTLCTDSFDNTRYEESIRKAQLLCFDEFACQWNELHSRHSTHGKLAYRRLNAILNTIRNDNKTTVLADADFTNEIVQQIAAAIGKPLVVHVLDAIDTTQRTVNFVTEQTALVDLKRQLTRENKVYFYSDSAAIVENTTMAIETLLPKIKTQAIHSRRGTGTSGENAVKQFVTNPNVESIKYDFIAASPTIENGTSIENGHFNRVTGLATGLKTSESFVQMSRRVRTANDINIAIIGHGFNNENGDAKTIAESIERRAIAQSAALNSYANITQYTKDCCALAAKQIADRNEYGVQIAAQFASRGYAIKSPEYSGNDLYAIQTLLSQLSTDSVDDKQRKKLMKKLDVQLSLKDDVITEASKNIKTVGKKEGDIALLDAIWNGRDIGDEEASRIQNAHSPSNADVAALARYDIQQTYGLPTGDLPPELVQLWQRGELDKKLARFRLALTPCVASERDTKDVEYSTDAALISGDLTRQQAIQAVLSCAGMADTEAMRTAVITADSARNVYKTLKHTVHGDVLTAEGMLNFKADCRRPIQWLGGFLKKISIHLVVDKHAGIGGRDGRQYKVLIDSYTTKKGNFKVGLELLIAIYESRFNSDSSRIEEWINAASVTRDIITDIKYALYGENDRRQRRVIISNILSTVT